MPAVPEVSVDEDGNPSVLEYKIWVSRQVAYVAFESIAVPPERDLEHPLRDSATRADSTHDPGDQC